MKLVGKGGQIINVDQAHGQMLVNTQMGRWKEYKEAVIEKPVVEDFTKEKRKPGRPRKEI